MYTILELERIDIDGRYPGSIDIFCFDGYGNGTFERLDSISDVNFQGVQSPESMVILPSMPKNFAASMLCLLAR